MACKGVQLPGGSFAIVCGARTRPRKCKGCGGRADLLCDWKVPTRRSGTCDAPICSACSTNPEFAGRTNFDKDLCPEHAEAFEAWKASR